MTLLRTENNSLRGYSGALRNTGAATQDRGTFEFNTGI
jgi:hypothetical protein